jgi:hypothetical protein
LHSGFPSLASDEFPAIVQAGEAVLNRRATSALGAGRIGALNRGFGGGGGSVTIIVNPSPGMDEEQLAAAVARRLPAELGRVMGVAL